MKATGLEFHLLTQEPWFRKHFDWNKIICGWCSQTGINEVKPCDEYSGHFQNEKIDFRFDTAWLNQFENNPDGDDFNYLDIKNCKRILLREIDFEKLKSLLKENL